jgi:hypothetical protein
LNFKGILAETEGFEFAVPAELGRIPAPIARLPYRENSPSNLLPALVHHLGGALKEFARTSHKELDF